MTHIFVINVVICYNFATLAWDFWGPVQYGLGLGTCSPQNNDGALLNLSSYTAKMQTHLLVFNFLVKVAKKNYLLFPVKGGRGQGGFVTSLLLLNT